MANNSDNKKYVSLTRLSTFLDNIKSMYSQIGHKHTTADLTDYAVDTELSSTSNNPVANSTLNAEFEAVSQGMNALELAIDGKADASHNHDDKYYTEIEIDTMIADVVYSDETDSQDATVPLNADTLEGHPASDFAPAGDYATESFVTNKIAEAQLSGDGSGDIDLSGYATKDDVTTISNLVGDTAVSAQISNAVGAIDFPVDSVNGKTGAVQLGASDVGAAPVGFGLGENTVNAGTPDGMDKNGYYHGIIAEPATGHSGNTYGEHIQYSDKYAYQRLIGMKASTGITPGTVRSRYKDNGTWSELEYENPPMLLGVEYRTTERYNGKPVYAKAVSKTFTTQQGDSSGSAIIGFEHGITGTLKVVRAEATINGQELLPYTTAAGTVSVISIDSANIRVCILNTVLDNPTFNVTLWYTKE